MPSARRRAVSGSYEAAEGPETVVSQPEPPTHLDT